mgnify:CR=1 FL=1
MAHLLLNLYRVPDDEAADVRRLLDEHRIPWYETQPSPWGISHGGIWVAEDRDVAEARRLFHEYQAERSARVRAEYAAAREAGTAPTFVGVLRANPLYVILALVAIVLVLLLSALPVWLLLA